MANLKSAKKRVHVNNKKRENNQAFLSKMRTEIKNVEHYIKEKDLDNAQKAYQSASHTIDKVIGKGVIHRNNGNRQKSRLARKLRKIS